MELSVSVGAHEYGRDFGSEAEQTFKNFHSMIRTQYNVGIKILRTDNGTEYYNSALGSFLLENGLVHQSSCVDTPQQNGVAERKNRHLLEVARSLMFTSNIPKKFWGDAILTACYLINRMPSRVLNYRKPLDHLVDKFPELSLTPYYAMTINESMGGSYTNAIIDWDCFKS